MSRLIFSFLLTFPVLASAQIAAKGYVVKAEGARIWLDLTSADGAAPGRRFQIYEEGAELKHPVSGDYLGKTETRVADGRMTEVAEKFSLGLLAEPVAQVRPGQRVRLLDIAAAPVMPASPRRSGEAELRAPRSRGAPLPFSITGMAVSDFDGVGQLQVVLSEDKIFRLYAYPAAENKALAQGTITGTGMRILSLEAGDLDGDKKSELFVSLYNEPFRRLETFVFRLNGGQWIKIADLPFLVRAHQNATGARVLGSQQIQDDKTFPYGAVYPLVYRNGQYTQGRPKVNPPRADWLYGFTYAQLDSAGEPAALSLTNINQLRVQFAKGHWTSSESFGQSPLRVRWHEKLLEIHPPMFAAYNTKGFDTLYLVHNLAMLGGLANPFGLFNGGELCAAQWTGVAFETAWKAELGGASSGFALVEPELGRKELIVAVSGSAGKSSVWTFDP